MISLARSLFVVVVLSWAGHAVHAEDFSVVAGHSEILFDAESGVPRRWIVCTPDCKADDALRALLLDVDDGYFRVDAPRRRDVPFSATVTETDEEVLVAFTAATEEYRYLISRSSPQVSVELPAGTSLEIASGAAFIPEPMPGFGEIYSRVSAIQVTGDGQESFPDPAAELTSIESDADSWMGMRNRYWALVAQPESGAIKAGVGLVEPDRAVLALDDESRSEPMRVRFYAGPTEWDSLKSVSPVLTEMLFAALWDFFRWLCFGMVMLLDLIYGVVGNYGVAIILLSLSVKILMSPLTMLADSWQAEVNRIQTLLQPELNEIKRKYKGEEAHVRTLEVYKKHSVNPLYTFKSAAGFLIQIPVFIAAFDMLAENIALSEVGFLWITDLARPDALAELPFTLPFFGGSLNLLPFLMTALSSLAAWLQSEDSLSPELQRKQSMRLYLMSAAFFVLFYTFPAGMVLYWTSSNLFHLLKVELGGLLKRS